MLYNNIPTNYFNTYDFLFNRRTWINNLKRSFINAIKNNESATEVINCVF
jgi:hypothetical protein